MKQRNETYDLMKGIALILMMLCHLVYTEGPMKHFIYSFHMPLFFILAGVFAKNIEDISSFKDFTLKNAKRLLLPYVVTMLMLCVWGGIQSIAKHDVSFFLRHFFSMITASADGWNSQWGLIYAGPMWFLIALFIVREIFAGLQFLCRHIGEKYRDLSIVGISLVLSVISVSIHPLLPSLPFCLMQAFTAIAFYAVGWYFHQHPIPQWLKIVCFLIWPIAIIYGGINIESCRIHYYLLSFIGAFGGTYAVYILCKVLEKLQTNITRLKPIFSPLAWCGKFTLPILCMHELEMYSGIMYSLKCRIPSIAIALGWGEIFLAIVMTIILIYVPYLKKVYI